MSTHSLTNARCFNHAVREAAARCPVCGRFYCRECVTEHEGKVLCSICIAKQTGEEEQATSSRAWFKRTLQLVAAFLLVWFVFFIVGQCLLLIPTVFHESKIS